MTFLDTVDGKLARVTVTSTPLGHYFDHSIDSVHPPIWYFAWAWGVTGGVPGIWTLAPLLVAILVAYVAGRLIETIFKHFVGGCSLFTWRPFDSYFRLIMARRNPNLLAADGLLSRGISGGRAHRGGGLDGALVDRPRGPSAPGRVARVALGAPPALARGARGRGRSGAAVGAPVRRRPCRRAPSRAVSSVLSSLGPHARRLDADPRRAELLPPRVTGDEPRRHPLRVALISNPTSGRNARRGLLAGIHDLLRAHPGVAHFEESTFDGIAAATRAAVADDTEIIVVNGGDGTVQTVLTSMLTHAGDAPAGPGGARRRHDQHDGAQRRLRQPSAGRAAALAGRVGARHARRHGRARTPSCAPISTTGRSTR